MVRFKIIAGYPGMNEKVGDILPTKHSNVIDYLSSFPHIFKELMWYEDITESEFPKYLRVVHSINHDTSVIGKVFETKPGNLNKYSAEGLRLKKSNVLGSIGSFDGIILQCFIPATEEEYLEYINKQKEKQFTKFNPDDTTFTERC